MKQIGCCKDSEEEDEMNLHADNMEHRLGFHVKKGYSIADLANQYIRKWEERRFDWKSKDDFESLPPAICLSRKIGAGALEIAETLGEMIGYPVLNREIIEHIADEAKLSDKTVRLFDGRYPGKLREFISMAFGERSFVQSDYIRHLFDVVFSMAGLGPAVFVGRGIHLALPRDRVLAVRIVASREYRIKRIVRVGDISEKRAEEILDQVDREQGAFFRNVYGKRSAPAYEFDLIINGDHIQNAHCAAELVSLSFQKKFTSEVPAFSRVAN